MTTLQAPQTRRHHHRRLFTCHRHPTSTPITGFCASCLRERLSTIEDSAASPTPATTTITSPRLRRTKSYSSPNPNSGGGASTSEPRRKSCDAGPRGGGNNDNDNDNTLSNLFTLDDQSKAERKPGAGPANAVLALREEDEMEEEEEGEFKTMKEFIDLELESKNCRLSFWESAASAFSKRLLKWKLQKQQQRKNKEENGSFAPEYDYKSAKSRRVRETESEMGLYGFLGRRSCDTDPRLSVDNGRYSFDEPRASWDGYLLGKALNPRPITPMAVVEEMEKEKEKKKVNLENEGEKSPGGSAQTRDYYGESLNVQRRRRSFDRSSSGKKGSFVDIDEVNNKSSISNAKVSPEIGLFHGAKLLVTEKELRDSNWYSIKDYRPECVESDSKNVGYVGGGVNEKGFKFKKSLRWQNVWNMWGFIQKRSEGKCADEERFSGGKVNVVDGPLAESWQKLKRVANGEANGTVSEKLIRSYSVSARNSFKVDGSFHGVVNGIEVKDNGVRKRDELVLHRNRGAAYSPNNLENGLLRFYLTPVRSYRRSRSGRSRI